MFMPVFNEARQLPGVLEEFERVKPPCDDVLIINNGSSDGSEVMVRESGHHYIDLPENLGVGYSYLKALEWALERDYDVLATMASNGKMRPSEMHRLFEPIEAGEADYVTGSRFLDGGASPNLPWFRRAAIPGVNTVVRVATGAKLTDATCGYRAFRLDIMRRAAFDWHDPSLYTYAFEYLIYAHVVVSKQFRYVEVPITMRYPPKGEPYSKIKPGADWWQMVRPWLTARVARKHFN